MLKKILRFAAYTVMFFLLLLVSLFTFPNEKIAPFQYDKYLITKAVKDDSPLKVGWAKRNISPSKAVRFAGYGLARNKSTQVHDSLFVRAVSFKKGNQNAVLVAYDLILAPPLVRKKLAEKLPSIGLTIDELFFTATHTHHSIGGWGVGLAGIFIAGGYDEDITENIVNQTIEAIREAKQTQDTAQVAYYDVDAPEYVSSRLHEDTTLLDTKIRYVTIKQNRGKTACLFSYSAHATCIDGLREEFSRDYAGEAVDFLEKEDFDFAVFSAGMVASHTPKDYGQHNYEWVKAMGQGLATKIIKNRNTIDSLPQIVANVRTTELSIQHIPLLYQDTDLRITPQLKLRNWAFKALYPDNAIYISILKINDILWFGLPCDFSGEFIKDLSVHHNALIITSFNGAYMGYVTPDKYHDLVHYETMELNWLGKRGNNLKDILAEIIFETTMR